MQSNEAASASGADGLEVIETDLDEFLVQVADELPSHIVALALHITRERAAELIGSVTGQDLPPDPDTLVQAACEYLRDKLVATMTDAAATLGMLPASATGQTMFSYVSFISGPSRSADIEMSLSLGIHGALGAPGAPRPSTAGASRLPAEGPGRASTTNRNGISCRQSTPAPSPDGSTAGCAPTVPQTAPAAQA